MPKIQEVHVGDVFVRTNPLLHERREEAMVISVDAVHDKDGKVVSWEAMLLTLRGREPVDSTYDFGGMSEITWRPRDWVFVKNDGWRPRSTKDRGGQRPASKDRSGRGAVGKAAPAHKADSAKAVPAAPAVGAASATGAASA